MPLTKEKKDTISVHEDFVYIGSKTYDTKYRISIGKVFNLFKKFSDFKEFGVYVGLQGDILLRPQVKIPARERWLYENPDAMKKFQQGIRDVIEGKVKRVEDLEDYLDSL
jgi:hypothetical protein